MYIRGDHAELVVEGRLDVRSAADARTVLHTAVDDGAGDLVLDLTGLDSWDATGLGVIMGAHRRAAGAVADSSCAVCPPRCSVCWWPRGCTASSPSRAASQQNRFRASDRSELSGPPAPPAGPRTILTRP